VEVEAVYLPGLQSDLEGELVRGEKLPRNRWVGASSTGTHIVGEDSADGHAADDLVVQLRQSRRHLVPGGCCYSRVRCRRSPGFRSQFGNGGCRQSSGPIARTEVARRDSSHALATSAAQSRRQRPMHRSDSFLYFIFKKSNLPAEVRFFFLN